METSPLSDETLLRGLRGHPHSRNRMASLLELAQGANPELKRADDAKDGLIQEIRALGTQTLQAWAHSQVHQTEQEVRHSARAQRGGKKNSAGTPSDSKATQAAWGLVAGGQRREHARAQGESGQW